MKGLKEQIAILEAQVAELEARESFHEYTIELLNETVIEQQQRIERLEKSLTNLVERLKRAALEEPYRFDPDVERPPHY